MKNERKRSLIIGGGSGIGLSIAKAFAARGDELILASRDIVKLKAAREEISSMSGSEIEIFCCDVTDEQTVLELREKIVSLDVLVCTAGMHLKSSVLETSLAEWNRVLEVNLTGTFLVNKIFAQLMKDNGGGSIINISSLGASRALSKASAYCVSKSGLEAVTRSFAVELAPFNIRVNAIVPGVFETELNKKALSDPHRRENILNCTPMSRFGRLPEVAGAALLLSSDDASFMTGSMINVDGGFLAYSGY